MNQKSPKGPKSILILTMKLLYTYFWKKLPVGALIWLAPIWLIWAQIAQPTSNHLKTVTCCFGKFSLPRACEQMKGPKLLWLEQNTSSLVLPVVSVLSNKHWSKSFSLSMYTWILSWIELRLSVGTQSPAEQRAQRVCPQTVTGFDLPFLGCCSA